MAGADAGGPLWGCAIQRLGVAWVRELATCALAWPAPWLGDHLCQSLGALPTYSHDAVVSHGRQSPLPLC